MPFHAARQHGRHVLHGLRRRGSGHRTGTGTTTGCGIIDGTSSPPSLAAAISQEICLQQETTQRACSTACSNYPTRYRYPDLGIIASNI